MNLANAIRASKLGEGMSFRSIKWDKNTIAAYFPGYPQGIGCNAITSYIYGIPEGTAIYVRPYLQKADGLYNIQMYHPEVRELMDDDFYVVESNSFNLIIPHPELPSDDIISIYINNDSLRKSRKMRRTTVNRMRTLYNNLISDYDFIRLLSIDFNNRVPSLEDKYMIESYHDSFFAFISLCDEIEKLAIYVRKIAE